MEAAKTTPDSSAFHSIHKYAYPRGLKSHRHSLDLQDAQNRDQDQIYSAQQSLIELTEPKDSLKFHFKRNSQ